ncbi:Hsp20/alpha crystallin family protein [Patulibacter defluvii]|uniref:Hsp20/alpha crystallin family protein n=1 Tax=Patulibacter defluvii TaxID=3095358 RepID=UPI002A754DEF|nr:Hsp20/alpha crystallin family protein [Patulibacter sp. DM4]
MTTIIRRPFADVADARARFDHLIDELLGASAGEARWAPAIDVHRDDDELRVTADVPGVAPEDVKITIQDGTLVISGEHEAESERDVDGYVRRERRRGAFRRTIGLPREADVHHVGATTKDGVVTVVVPLKAEAAPPVIEITPRSDEQS